MKVFATYDRSGNIVGVAIAAADVKDGDFHLVAEMKSGLTHRRNQTGKILHRKDDAVPAARLLRTTIRHGAGARRSRPAEKDLRFSQRHTGERRKLLVFQREPKVIGVERDRPRDVSHLISDTVKGLNSTFRARVFHRCGR